MTKCGARIQTELSYGHGFNCSLEEGHEGEHEAEERWFGGVDDYKFLVVKARWTGDHRMRCKLCGILTSKLRSLDFLQRKELYGTVKKLIVWFIEKLLTVKVHDGYKRDRKIIVCDECYGKY